MAVVTKYGTGYKDPASLKAVDAAFAEGNLKAICSSVAIANGDSATSVLLLGKVPSNAIILPASTYYYSAITGLNSLHIGFGQNGAVIAGKSNALVNAKDVTSAGSASLTTAVATGSQVQKAWQLAGFTTDPGGMLDILATMNAGATAAGSIDLFLQYAKLV